MKMTNAGIDYGLGTINVDTKTGIRYGVISQHSVGQSWYEQAQPDYGSPTCPKCGCDASTFADCSETEHTSLWAKSSGCRDYMCVRCRYVFDSSEAFGDEPDGWTYSDDEYELVSCLDSDIMVLKSPYYTHAQFCSPCVPGAGNLDNPMDDGVKAYCLGPEWFEDDKAPYPIHRVA